MFKTRRQEHYVKLCNAGFLKFEAYPLSKVPWKTPYLQGLVRQRQRRLKDSVQAKITIRQYEDSIKALYRSNRWLKRNRVGKIVADPWRMLRDAEDKWKEQQATYESPWVRKYKDFRDFRARIERIMRQQRGLQPG